MKMTLLLWRTVTVWLCVAVVFLCFNSHVGCKELHKAAQRPENAQDVHSKEALGQITQNENPNPTQSFSENEHLKDVEEEPNEDGHVIKGEKKMKTHLQVDDSKVLNVDNFVAEEAIHNEHQLKSENEVLEVPPGNDQDTLPSLEQYSSFAAEFKDGPLQHFADEVTDIVSERPTDIADVVDSDPPLANCEVEPSPFDSESSLPVVLENTSNAHTTGTQSDPPLSSPAAHSPQHLEANVSHKLKGEDLSSTVTTETESSVGSKDPEDIPTFDEWKRKMMEVEKEKSVTTHTSTNGAVQPVKKVQKNFNNYASVECGAKILGANPEAKSTSSILKENMDLYMLNPCSNKIWFIIELCEPVQVKQLDIANFELFSSTPKDFLVSISDRYPTNKWLKLGTFHARDERTVQSFPLDEQLYAKYVKMFTKYIKVELVSHFGSEHFCPLSLIRVFGTSMVEEYEEIAEPPERPEDQDDDMDYPPGYGPGEVDSKNLIGSAKDAIFNIVKDIAVVLGGGEDMSGNVTSQEVNMTEPLPQLETTTETSITDLQLGPDLEYLSEDTTSGSQTSETPDTDSNIDELVDTEEQIVIPLEKDEDEPISSTIILLGEEEELDEEKQEEQQQESTDDCALLPSSSHCSCAASLHEYLLQQCLLHMPKKCKLCQTADKLQPDVPNWVLHQSSPFYPQPQHPLKDTEVPSEKEDDLELEGKKPSFSENPQPPHNVSLSEPLSVEPSQTEDLSISSDLSLAKDTPVVEMPELVTQEPTNCSNLEISSDFATEVKETEPTEAPSSSGNTKPTGSTMFDDASRSQDKTILDDSQQEIKSPDEKDNSQQDTKPKTPQLELDSAVSPEAVNELSHLEPIPDPLPSEVMDAKMEDFAEDITTSSGNPRPPAAVPSLSDVYAEPPNSTEQNGNPVHGSSQKESVFMRLNNRIKALEMNMSLSGRYLEQLSQRYRKQMEEMQKAFNKTIIKLQNTSRVAEEQDLRQTESIQLLQGQLEKITELVLNLSVQVSQLQNEVSDRESYLLLSLFLCLCLGLLLYVNRCRMTPTSCPEPEPPIPKSYTYCCPEMQFSCDEAALKRSASYPLIHSESFHLPSTMGPEILQIDETQSLHQVNKKRRRRKVKSLEKVETLKPSLHAAPEPLQNKEHVLCNGLSVLTDPTPLTQRLLEPTFRDSPSDGSSEGSSHSEDPSFCGITAACNRICDGLPPPKTRAERRALRRRRPGPCGVVDYLKAPSRQKRNSLPIYTIHDVIERQEQSSRTYGVNVNRSGPV